MCMGGYTVQTATTPPPSKQPATKQKNRTRKTKQKRTSPGAMVLSTACGGTSGTSHNKNAPPRALSVRLHKHTSVSTVGVGDEQKDTTSTINTSDFSGESLAANQLRVPLARDCRILLAGPCLPYWLFSWQPPNVKINFLPTRTPIRLFCEVDTTTPPFASVDVTVPGIRQLHNYCYVR